MIDESTRRGLRMFIDDPPTSDLAVVGKELLVILPSLLDTIDELERELNKANKYIKSWSDQGA
jgi:hypothetical protein